MNSSISNPAIAILELCGKFATIRADGKSDKNIQNNICN